jgi:hypothetical protein
MARRHVESLGCLEMGGAIVWSLWHGGLRHGTLLSARVEGAGTRGAAYAAAICESLPQAQPERRRRRRGNLRNRQATHDAFRARKDERAVIRAADAPRAGPGESSNGEVQRRDFLTAV